MVPLKKFSIEYLVGLLDQVCQIKHINHKTLKNVYEIDARTAYRFALCTQSTYLNHEFNGLYVKKLFTTLNMRGYDLKDGLFEFENEILKNINTQDQISRFPELFSKPKRIIFVKGKFSTRKMSESYQLILSCNKDPSQYILSFVDPYGSEWEQFYEFYISEYFISKEKITDVQLPWPYGGFPDTGYTKHNLSSVLGGFLVSELSMLRHLFLEKIDLSNLREETYTKMAVIEVKSSQLRSQAKKYLNQGFTNVIYEFFPNGLKANEPLGLINFVDKTLNFIKPDNRDLTYKESDKRWFNVYLKIHLLSNLTLEELKLLINNRKIEKKDILIMAKELTFRDIINEINNGK